MRSKYRHTLYASFIGYIVQAIVNIFPALLIAGILLKKTLQKA